MNSVAGHGLAVPVPHSFAKEGRGLWLIAEEIQAVFYDVLEWFVMI